MRSMTIAALSAALLFGCGDDDEAGDDDVRNDASVKTDASTNNNLDGGGGIDAATSDGGVTRASARLESKNDSGVTGSAAFALLNGKVSLEITISGAKPGEHGIHIHDKGDCSAADASSAGGHWNPDNHTHGSGSADASTSSHLGDLGNILIGGDGKGVLEISKAEWTLGSGAITDVLNHAIVFHANEDDLVTQNGDAGPGNSGGRQACGVITALR